jgi:hypothetical protein
MSATQVRIVGLVGLGATLCFVIAFLLDPVPPGAGASSATVLSHALQYSGNDRAAGFLFGLSGAGLVVVISGLRHWFLDISAAPRWLGTAMLSGAILAGAMLVSASALFFTLGAHPLMAADTASVLNDLVNYGFVFAGFGVLVTIVSATSIMLATYGPLQLLGRFGVGVIVLQIPYLLTAFFTSGPLQAGGIVSIIGFGAAGLWVFMVSVTLLWFARLAAAASR